MSKIKITIIYNWTLSKQLVLSGILMCIVFFVVYAYLLEIKEETYLQNVRLEEQLKNEYINKYAVYKNLPAYELQNKQLRELNKQLLDKFPNEIEMGDLMFEINQLGKNNFIQINMFQPQDTLYDGSGLTLQVVKVNLSGEYINFTNFMTDLAKLSKVTNVTDLNMTRNSDDNISVSFNLAIHFNK